MADISVVRFRVSEVQNLVQCLQMACNGGDLEDPDSLALSAVADKALVQLMEIVDYIDGKAEDAD